MNVSNNNSQSESNYDNAQHSTLVKNKTPSLSIIMKNSPVVSSPVYKPILAQEFRISENLVHQQISNRSQHSLLENSSSKHLSSQEFAVGSV